MKRATKILGTATVIGLLAVPVAQSYDDWITPLLWDWAVRIAHPMLQDHEAEIADLESRLAAAESSAQPRLVVLDANDQELPILVGPADVTSNTNYSSFYGIYLYGSNPVPVEYFISGGSVRFETTGVGIVDSVFATRNCTGPASASAYYLVLGQAPLHPLHGSSLITPLIALINGTFYRLGEGADAINFPVASRFDDGGQCYEMGADSFAFVPAEIIGELAATMPLRLEVRE